MPLQVSDKFAAPIGSAWWKKKTANLYLNVTWYKLWFNNLYCFNYLNVGNLNVAIENGYPGLSLDDLSCWGQFIIFLSKTLEYGIEIEVYTNG